MKKKLWITLLMAIMVLGLYSSTSFAINITSADRAATKAQEGTAVYESGKYSFTPKTTGIYYYHYSYTYVNSSTKKSETRNTYYLSFTDYDGYYCHMLQANETYYF